MSIRFKFRSSVNFDTIEIDGGKPYISVGELRSKILCQKKLNGICHKDFDLVFFDDLTGQEYNDDKFKIPSGSSVIIKRVPAEPGPSAMLRHHKLGVTELNEDIPKGMDCNKPEGIVPEKEFAPGDIEHLKLEKVANTTGIDLQKVDLPSELRCPICNTYFKEAVMIPCCQHSFCKKCICEVLPQTTSCPKCSSTKYRVEHLLPNLSLRHAIEHFLESQIIATAPEINLQKYVPDGESGIQGKEVPKVTKRKLDLLYPTSATEKGSNQNMAESGAVGLLNSTPLLKVNNNSGRRDTYEDFAPSADSQGENQPVMPQVCMPDEADSTTRKRGSWVNSGGGDRSYAVDNRNKKVGRTCYMCGSPGHFIRNCPIASTENPMFHAGHAMPYWNAAAFPPVNPYMNMYGNPGMMPFNATMVPVTPYGIPPYVPPMYGNLAVPSGIMRMGYLTPVGTRAEQPSRHSENLELQNNYNRIKYFHEKRQRSSDYEGDRIQKSSEYKSSRDRGKAPSNSEESHGRKLQKDHRYDKHPDQRIKYGHEKYEKRSHSTNDRSISGVEDVHSGNYRYDEARHKKYHNSSRRHQNSREQSDSDCSYKIKNERDAKRKESYEHKHSGHMYGSEPSYSGDQKKLRNKRKTVNDSDEEYHHNKRKSGH